MRRVGTGIILLGMLVSGFGQHKAIDKNSVDDRIRMHSALEQDEDKIRAVEFANDNNLPVRVVEEDGTVREIRRIIEDRHPEYLITHNITSARTISTEALWDGIIEGIQLNGEGMIAAVWDAGKILTSHVEFANRARNFDVGSAIVGHATHVAGTIGATGIVREAHGMANKIQIESHDWDRDNQEMRLAAENGLLLSNHSYGSINGFDYNSSEQRWEWYGDPDISRTEDYSFGIYGIDAQVWDDISYENPFYLIVKSAGNDRLEGPSTDPTHFIWDNGWQQSSMRRDLDGGPDGFDCIGSSGTAKNILTVGAVRDIESGYQNPEDVVMTSFSCFGPTDDGRIKPDIVTNGQGLYSTYYNSDTDYRRLNGTSMAAPSATGSLALLQQLHQIKFERYMRSATLKALVLHSADDAGHPGPDYKFGWGLMNTRKAAELISNSETKSVTIKEDSISRDQYIEYYVFVDGSRDAKATICWTDPEGKRPTRSVDPKDTILVNDLDLRISKRSAETVFYPFILDPENPNQAASTGDNFRDNIEMISFLAEEGFYSLSLSHKGDIKDSIQNYSLVLEGMYEVYLAQASDTLTGNNGEFQITSAPVYPSNSTFSWLVEPENELAINLTFESFQTDPGDILRIYDGPDSNFPLLAEFSGTLPNPDTLIKSGGASVFLEFTSLENANSQGFKVNYCTVAPANVASIYGENMPCIGSTEAYHVDAESGISYSWNITEASIDTSIITMSLIELKDIDLPLKLSVTPQNSCGIGEETTLQIKPVSIAPDVAGTITGDTLPCINSENIYSVEYNNEARYNWIIPEGWTGSNDSSRIWINPLLESGIIKVIPYNGCGTDDTIEIAVNALDVPDYPPIITENASPCQNSIQDFIVTPVEGIKYRWEADQNWEIIGSDTSDRAKLKIDEASRGTLFLSASNKCGNSRIARDYEFSPQPAMPQLLQLESSIPGYNELFLENFEQYTYVRWIFNNSELANDQESVLIQRNGEYSLYVSNNEGCTRQLDIEERILVNDENLVFSVYGLNTAGQFLIMNDTPENAYLEGYDLMGKAIFKADLTPGANYFSTRDRGAIILKITGSGYTRKQLIILP